MANAMQEGRQGADNAAEEAAMSKRAPRNKSRAGKDAITPQILRKDDNIWIHCRGR